MLGALGFPRQLTSIFICDRKPFDASAHTNYLIWIFKERRPESLSNREESIIHKLCKPSTLHVGFLFSCRALSLPGKRWGIIRAVKLSSTVPTQAPLAFAERPDHAEEVRIIRATKLSSTVPSRVLEPSRNASAAPRKARILQKCGGLSSRDFQADGNSSFILNSKY